MLAKKAASASAREQHRLQNTLGKVLAALRQERGALKAYQAAHQLDLTDQETIRGLADVCFKLQRLGRRAHQLPEGADEPRRGARPSSGPTSTTSSAASSRPRARPSRRSTTSRRPSASTRATAPTLDAMVAVYDGLKDWKQVCHYKRQILDNVVDGGERYRMLQEIGDVWTDKENNLPKGIEALEEALELEPQNHVLLHKLLQLYQKTQPVGADGRHRSSASPTWRCSRSGRAATSTRWRSSTATSSTIRCARSTSSTRRSI